MQPKAETAALCRAELRQGDDSAGAELRDTIKKATEREKKQGEATERERMYRNVPTANAPTATV